MNNTPSLYLAVNAIRSLACYSEACTNFTSISQYALETLEHIWKEKTDRSEALDIAVQFLKYAVTIDENQPGYDWYDHVNQKALDALHEIWVLEGKEQAVKGEK